MPIRVVGMANHPCLHFHYQPPQLVTLFMTYYTLHFHPGQFFSFVRLLREDQRKPSMRFVLLILCLAS